MMATIIAGVSAGIANADEEGVFNARERAFSLFGSYVDKPGDYGGMGVGVTYYITRQFGIGAVTHVEDVGGTFIDNVAGEGYFRFPLKSTPIAPYVTAAIGRSFETHEMFYSAGGGVEWQWMPRFRAFGDLSWQINDDSRDGLALRLGVRLGF